MADDGNFMDELMGVDSSPEPTPTEPDFLSDDAYLGSSDFEDIAPAPTPVKTVVESTEPAPDSTTPPEVPEPTEVDSLREQNALLLARLNEIQESLNTREVPAVAPLAQPAAPVQPTQAPSAPVDIFDGQDFDEVLSDKTKFMAMMGKVGQAILDTAYQTIAQTLPNVVVEQVNYNQKMKEVVDEFYSAHEDLKAVKPTVSAVMQKVQGENPSLSIQEVLVKTAETTRSLLGLNRSIAKPPAAPSNPPPAPGSGSNRMGAAVSTKTTVSDELDFLKNLGF